MHVVSGMMVLVTVHTLVTTVVAVTCDVTYGLAGAVRLVADLQGDLHCPVRVGSKLTFLDLGGGVHQLPVTSFLEVVGANAALFACHRVDGLVDHYLARVVGPGTKGDGAVVDLRPVDVFTFDTVAGVLDERHFAAVVNEGVFEFVGFQVVSPARNRWNPDERGVKLHAFYTSIIKGIPGQKLICPRHNQHAADIESPLQRVQSIDLEQAVGDLEVDGLSVVLDRSNPVWIRVAGMQTLYELMLKALVLIDSKYPSNQCKH